MKRAEKILFHKLNNQDKDQPLSNVRKALGSVSFAKGNPFTKTEIQITIQIHYADALGNPIAFGVLTPAQQQSFLPCYIFGLTDFYGGFARMRNLLPAHPEWNIVAWTIAGFTAFGYPAWMNVQFGDLVLVFAATAPAPNNNQAVVVVHCNNVAFGTFLNSFVSDLITISVMRYIVPIANVVQFIHPLIIGYQSLFGKVAVDYIDPRMYIKPKDFQQQISDIPINLPIEKSVLMGTNIDAACQLIQLVLFVQKVEALTNRPKN